MANRRELVNKEVAIARREKLPTNERAAWSAVFIGLALAATAAQRPAVFQDRTAELGLQLANAPACWADLNNDGWTDLCAGGVVWLNNNAKKFTRLAEGLGPVVAADFDNDGYVDLFSWASQRAYHNEPGKRFTPLPMPKLPPSRSLGACWGDFNGDGFVDLYVAGYEDWGKGNQNDLPLHFGLGKFSGPLVLKILWPGGEKQTVRVERIDQRVRMVYHRP